MGYSHWSDAAFSSRQGTRKATGATAFTYDAHVRATGAAAVHPQMDPKGVTRQSRDSADHPSSLSIAVLFDVTGSMGNIPRVLQSKLGALMRMLIQQGYVEHPQMLFGAVGDAYCDRVPLQIGQFESGLEMDDDLGRIFIEGGGGGQMTESYELAMYFMAHHTAMDCWEKRGKRGYLFTIGDEMPYGEVNAKQIREIIGDGAERNVPIAELLADLHRTFEHFHIIPLSSATGRRPEVQARWRELLGERVLLLDDEAAVCETIALAIALCEGTLDSLYRGSAALVGAGYDAASAASASAALVPYASQRPAVATISGALATAPDDGLVARL